jgi:hypothetical protein
MTQFYIPDEDTKMRCDKSRNSRKPDTFSGVDALKGNVQMYTGVVQSVEDFGPGAPDGRRYRVTIFPD